MLFEQLCIALQALEPIEALVLGGSRAGDVYDQKSDYDLYVYCTELPSPEARMGLLRRVCDRIELGNDFWELEDDCVLKDGIPVDILYRSLDAFAQDVAAVVEGYSARNGYTTCMWHNLLHSRILYDRDGRYAALQKRFDVPYPEQLRQNILRRNLRLITGNFPSYDEQLRKAVSRGDTPSINHRMTAFLESYFDILFALNRMTHPGEKRMLTALKTQATILPANFEETLNEAFANMFTNPGHFLTAIDKLVHGLVEVAEQETVR